MLDGSGVKAMPGSIPTPNSGKLNFSSSLYLKKICSLRIHKEGINNLFVKEILPHSRKWKSYIRKFV